MSSLHQPITIFSGGSAANSLAPIFTSLSTSKSCSLAYIIPISDNGGSSSELIRVFGGPGIGDVRSRLVRLIPRLSKSSPGWREREGIRSLLSHRLSSDSTSKAREQWNDVVDGTSLLWKDISSAKKELIRSIFNLVNLEIIKRSRPPGSTFDFTSASVGNLFLTGARLFTGSFESAIYLMGSICGINDEDVKVIPSINSNFSHHIAAGLEDGSVIVGQNAISHPSAEPVGRDPKVVGNMSGLIHQSGWDDNQNESLDGRRLSTEHYYGDEEGRYVGTYEEEEDANLPGTLLTLRTKNIAFTKNDNEELPAKISRIWYINPYGQEILPPANPRAVTAINNASAIIYSIGSLYTSLVPSLILKGVGEAIRKTATAGTSRSRIRTKILILNGSLDREVGPQPSDPRKVFSALDFVEAIVRAGEQSRGIVWQARRDGVQLSGEGFHHSPSHNKSPWQQRATRPSLFTIKSESSTTTLASLQHEKLSHLFPPPLPASSVPSRDPSPVPSPTLGSSADHSASESLPGSTTTPPRARNIDPIYNDYITHIIHLPNSPTTPYVDREMLLRQCGIQTVKVYGRREGDDKSGPMLYDHAALKGAIEAILGRNPDKGVAGARKRSSESKDVDVDTKDEADEEDEELEEGSLTRKRTREDERRRLKQGGRRNTVDSY